MIPCASLTYGQLVADRTAIARFGFANEAGAAQHGMVRTGVTLHPVRRIFPTPSLCLRSGRLVRPHLSSKDQRCAADLTGAERADCGICFSSRATALESQAKKPVNGGSSTCVNIRFSSRFSPCPSFRVATRPKGSALLAVRPLVRSSRMRPTTTLSRAQRSVRLLAPIATTWASASNTLNIGLAAGQDPGGLGYAYLNAIGDSVPGGIFVSINRTSNHEERGGRYPHPRGRD